jgi:gamma-glutamylcyclotransferase (GGCT)/AIG2-like uncharacterized protein YtfP
LLVLPAAGENEEEEEEEEEQEEEQEDNILHSSSSPRSRLKLESKTWTAISEARNPGTTFFVYGSLRPDDVTGMPWRDHWLAGGTCHRGVIHGRMYDDTYASVVLPEEEKEEKEEETAPPTVFGWLVEYSEEAYLKKLKEGDEIEGYPQLYGREKVVVRCDNGTCCVAWCYVRPNCSKDVCVLGGDWVEYQLEKVRRRSERSERRESETRSSSETSGGGRIKNPRKGARQGAASQGAAKWCPLLKNVVCNAVASIQMYGQETNETSSCLVVSFLFPDFERLLFLTTLIISFYICYFWLLWTIIIFINMRRH